MRKCLPIIVIMLLASSVARAAKPAPTKADGPSEFRAGWREVAAPVLGHEGKNPLQARQEALMAAIPHFESAVSANPGDASYRLSLGYVYLAAGKYQQAKEALSEAVQRSRKNPLPYLFRAQAEAAISFMAPETKGKTIGTALRLFDDAARLDPTNSLALIQAASVAAEAGKQSMGVAKIEAALQRPGMMLYRLPIPGDLDPSKSNSAKMWQHAQLWQWLELLARSQNAARVMIKFGREKEAGGDLEGAEAVYRQVLVLGRQVGNAQPNTFVAVNTGMDIMEDAYTSLSHLYEPYPLQMQDSDWSWAREGDDQVVVRGSIKNVSASPLQGLTAVVRWMKADGGFMSSVTAPLADQTLAPGKSSTFEVKTTWNPAMDHPVIGFKNGNGGIPYEPEWSPERKAKATEKTREVEAWKGEIGVLYIGRGDMVGALQGYMKSLDEHPPASIDEMLDREGERVAHTMLGVGLSPTHKPLKPGKQVSPVVPAQR